VEEYHKLQLEGIRTHPAYDRGSFTIEEANECFENVNDYYFNDRLPKAPHMKELVEEFEQ
jgi:hypothetical protein